MALQDIFRVPRDILGNPVPRCCTEVCPATRRRFSQIRQTHHLPASLMESLWTMEERQAGSSNNRLFLPRSPFPVPRPLAAHSSARHAKNDAMRCAFVQRSQFARASRPLPLSLSPSLLASVPRRAALINRGAQTSGSAAAAVRIRRSRSFAFTVAAFLNTVTVRK